MKQVRIETPWGEALGKLDQGIFTPFSEFVLSWWKRLSREDQNTLLKIEPEIKIECDHLEENFHRLNLEYFENKLKKPSLRWGRKRNNRKSSIVYGYYDPKRYLITMNPILKEDFVPFHVFEYVLFHEMLHIKVKGKHVKIGRRKVFQVHTKEFREAEKVYKQYKESKAWLKENFKRIMSHQIT